MNDQWIKNGIAKEHQRRADVNEVRKVLPAFIDALERALKLAADLYTQAFPDDKVSIVPNRDTFTIDVSLEAPGRRCSASITVDEDKPQVCCAFRDVGSKSDFKKIFTVTGLVNTADSRAEDILRPMLFR